MRRIVLAFAFVLPGFAASAADIFACKLSDDRRSVTVSVSNPYAQETHCHVNCHVAIPGSGMASISCGKTVPGAATDLVLCTRSRDNNALYAKLDGGNAECVKPLAQNKDDDEDDEKLIQRLQKQGQDMLRQMQKR